MTTPDNGGQQDGGNQQQDGGAGGQQGTPQGGQGGKGGQQQDLDAPKFSQKWANDFEARLRRDYSEKADKDKALIEKGKEYEALLAESQPLSERVQSLSVESAQKDSTIAEKDLTIRRLQLAYEAGLPPALGRRVQGKTEEEIRADIEDLKKDLANSGGGQGQGQGGGLRPNPQQGAPSPDSNRQGSVSAGRSLWEQKHQKADAASK